MKNLIFHFFTFSLFHLFTCYLFRLSGSRRFCCSGAACGSRCRTLLTKASSVTLACVCGFQLRLLSGRNEVRMLFEIFDDLFADHFAFKATQSGLDRFARIYCNKSHFVFSPPFGKESPSSGKPLLNRFRLNLATVNRDLLEDRFENLYNKLHDGLRQIL